VNIAAKTDWDRYYDDVPWTARVTRAITANLLIEILKRQNFGRRSIIVEAGGANSCFFEPFCRAFDPMKYIVIDSNTKGLEKFRWSNRGNTVAESLQGDVLNGADNLRGRADLVFSAGLIEHFDPDGTKRAVETHFDIARPGALVLLTFPTPVMVYQVIRSCLEVVGRWNFPDERPLLYDEVRNAVSPFGKIVAERINRAIGLAQGIIVARKFG
jgi:hypothetical protein